MRNWRVWVKSGDGRQFAARALEISADRAVLRGEHVLPGGMLCDLQIIIPAADETKSATTAGLQAEVGHAVFAAGHVRLECRVVSLSREARQLIESRKG
jgi:hypothetical protein